MNISKIQNRSKSVLKSIRGFTLTEIIIGVVVLGILAAGVSYYMSGATTSATANTGANNVSEINNAIVGLQASGASLVSAAYVAPVNGTANTGATITLDAVAVPANITTFLKVLQPPGTGILSYGNTAHIGNTLTTTSYTYTWVGGVPIFTYIAGSPP